MRLKAQPSAKRGRSEFVDCIKPGEVGKIVSVSHVKALAGSPQARSVNREKSLKEVLVVRGPRNTERGYLRDVLVRVPLVGDSVALVPECSISEQLGDGEGTTKCLLAGEKGVVVRFDEELHHPLTVRGPRGDSSQYAVNEVTVVPRAGMRIRKQKGEASENIYEHGIVQRVVQRVEMNARTWQYVVISTASTVTLHFVRILGNSY